MIKYNLAPDGLLPFIQFPDMQAYADSLSLKDLQRWNDIFSDKENVNPEWIQAATALYTIEKGAESIDLSENEIIDLCNHFSISISLLHNVRIGHIVVTSGRVLMSDPNNAKFKMTDAGIKHVENIIMKP